MRFKKWWYKFRGITPDKLPMVQYWKFKESVAAKVTKAPDGSLIMILEGEKHPFPTFPRGHLLFGPLSKLKHEIKNQVFNESWAELEQRKDRKEIIKRIKEKLFTELPKYFEPMKYDVLPFKSLTPSVREIHRAWTAVAPEHTYILRDYLCFILQEDDGYRMRVQWLVSWFGWFAKWKPVKTFEYALTMLEHGEVIGDMKERQRLLKRILMLCLEDEKIKDLFVKFFKEVDWEKVKLTKGDKFHFRGKYFFVDLDVLEY